MQYDIKDMVERMYDGGGELTNIVIDLETTVRAPDGFKADPFYKDNEIVLAGWWVLREGFIPITGHVSDLIQFIHETERVRLIGQNIKFDLHYLRKAGLTMAYVHHVMDCMVIEHTLYGTVMASMDKMAAKYGLPLKPTELQEMWDSGVQTEDIDKDFLKNYLLHDIRTTAAIYAKQMDTLRHANGMCSWAGNTNKIVKRLNMKGFVALALQEIEWNGLHVDLSSLRLAYNATHLDLGDAELAIQNIMESLWGATQYNKIIKDNKPFGSKLLSATLYGKPPIKYKERQTVGKFKNGKPKTKLMDVCATPLPLAQNYVKPPKGTNYNATLGYSTDKITLKKLLSKHMLGVMHRKLVESVLKRRGASKLESTYLVPIEEYIQRQGETIIHPTYNQAVANTERLTSSNPNGQNMPTKIHSMFTSRYTNGRKVKADWKQIEICALAEECKDRQLIEDLTMGVDVHEATGQTVYGTGYSMSPEERRDIKGVNFGTIYGGGPRTISEQTGVRMSLVEKIQIALLDRYKGIENWYYSYAANVNRALMPTNRHGPSGSVVYESIMYSTTGHIYRYETEEKYGKSMALVPTKIKNRPIQGLATGDLVPMGLVLVFMHQRWYDSTSILSNMIMDNTVHDEMTFDSVDSGLGHKTERCIDYICTTGVEYAFKELTGGAIEVPLQLEITVDKHW